MLYHIVVKTLDSGVKYPASDYCTATYHSVTLSYVSVFSSECEKNDSIYFIGSDEDQMN